MKIRKATISDREALADIYRAVAANVAGISRQPHEITDTYVYSLLNKKDDDAVILIAANDDFEVIGAILAVKNGLEAYKHILSELTVIVKPDVQSKGVGTKLSFAFLEHIFTSRPDVMRVEMEVVHDLEKVPVYEAAGFIKEGETKNRIRHKYGKFSDSILMAWVNPNFKG